MHWGAFSMACGVQQLSGKALDVRPNRWMQDVLPLSRYIYGINIFQWIDAFRLKAFSALHASTTSSISSWRYHTSLWKNSTDAAWTASAPASRWPPKYWPGSYRQSCFVRLLFSNQLKRWTTVEFIREVIWWLCPTSCIQMLDAHIISLELLFKYSEERRDDESGMYLTLSALPPVPPSVSSARSLHDIKW